MFRDVTTHKRGEEAVKREHRASDEYAAIARTAPPAHRLRSPRRTRAGSGRRGHAPRGRPAGVANVRRACAPTTSARPSACCERFDRRGAEADRGLRPPVLNEYGLVAAIDYLIRELPRDRIEIEFVHEVRFDRLDALLEATVFHIIQEALNNIRQHGGARPAHIALTQIGDRIQIEVRDWGRGFDPAVAHENRYGLQGISRTGAVAAGYAAVEGSPGKGTRLFVDLPLTYPLETASERGKPGAFDLLIADDHEVVRSGLKSMLAGTEVKWSAKWPPARRR